MRIVLALGLFATLGACALTTDTIDVSYESAGPPQPVVGGAGEVKILVAARDARPTHRDRVSSKKNGFGMEMAPIVASNDVVEAVGRAIERELAARGFAVGPGGVSVTVEVIRFYNDFGVGAFSGDALAEVAFRLVALGPDGATLYTRQYAGEGRETGVMLFTGDNARTALVSALSNGVQQAASDPSLIAALLTAASRDRQGTAAARKPTS